MYDRHDKLKALTRLAIKKAGNLDVASEATGICMTALSNAQRGENDKRSNWLTLPEIDALEQFIGAPVITGRLASEFASGHQPLPHNTKISASNLMTFANTEAKEKLERDQAVEQALQDGEISNGELDRLIKEQEDVMRAAQSHHDWLCGVRTARRKAEANAPAWWVSDDPRQASRNPGRLARRSRDRPGVRGKRRARPVRGNAQRHPAD